MAEPNNPTVPAARAHTGVIGGLRARLAARPDSEHEQAVMRLFNTLAIGLYLMPEFSEHWAVRAVCVTYLAGGVLILAGILVSPGASPSRRVLGALIDVSMVTYCLTAFGERGAPLFMFLLWITLANGFRFGARYLVVSLVFSVVGFAVVLLSSDFWVAHRGLGIGLMLGLIVLSLYVRKLVMQLHDAVARAEAANQAKRRFISVVSHEMRTPLNAIIGMADLLRDTSLNREQADMLQTLRGSSRVMLGLIEDVLDFSKIEAGKVVLERTDFDLHALVNSTSRIVTAQAAAKGIDFLVSIMPEVPPLVRGDPHHLRQVLINLAGNAVKFTERGSVTVHVSAQGESDASVQVKFSVRDTGIGIPPEARERIFDSFTQADESTTRRFGGTGLGTTIARQLVNMMGGRIGLESAVGLGSTFWFELELAKQSERPSAGAGELAGARILLAGFPQAEREPLEAALRNWGAAPVVAATIEDAVGRVVAEISVAKPYHSALIYTGDDDLKSVQHFRRAAPQPAPPAILVLPRASGVARFAALSSGFASVLQLPVDKRQLFNVLHSVTAGDQVHEGVVRLRDYAQRGASARKLRILVADDNPTNREVIGKILERGGHVVTHVTDGDQVLDAVERTSPDLVILDRNMPGMSGIEALQALRLITGGQERLPVIMLSADATPEAKREALDAGADAFLSKPIEAVRLLDEISVLGAAAEQVKRRAQPPSLLAPRQQPVTEAAVVNMETLRHLEELGGSSKFLEQVIGVFLADNGELEKRVQHAIAARDFGEFRSLVHAMKGSSASMGTDRLTHLCTNFGALSDSELRVRAPALLRSLDEETSAARSELERYLRERKQSAG
jgi:two-component system, sensor histidine kinase RpfC